MPCKEPCNITEMLTLYWWIQQFYKLSGGRPMIEIGDAFTDVVSGKQVRYYQDRFGRLWLADNGPWSVFRVQKDNDQ